MKTDPVQIKNCISVLTELLSQLETVSKAGPVLEKNLRASISGVKRRELRKQLIAMDVDELSREKLSVRLSALREAGIDNLWQIYDMSLADLTAIDGFGEQSAERVKKSVDDLAKAIEETIRVRISIDDRTPENLSLIQSLHLYVHARPLCEGADMLLNRHAARIRSAIAEARPLQNTLTRLLTFGKRKEQAARSGEYLIQQINGPFAEGASDIVREYAGLKKMTAEQRLQAFGENAAVYLAELEKFLPALPEPSREGLPAELVDAIEKVEPDLSLLKATLRSYQLFGCKYVLHQQRVLLGDEMGLGKTVQAIAAMAVQAAAGKQKFIVVCPASVLINWCREIAQHSHLTAVKVHGADRAEAFARWMDEGGVAVTTYETLSRIDWPEGFACDMLVVDEAHYVKNPQAKRTQAMQKLADAAESVLFMTGTPLENDVEEMCALVRMLDFGLSEELKKYTSLAAAAKFRNALAPVYLRRVREDVLTELPDLIENQDWCEMNKEEKKRYAKAVLSRNFAAMRQVSWNVDDLAQSSKAQRLLEICDEAKEGRRKVIVFSFFLSTIEKARTLLADRCAGVITGSIAPDERQKILDGFKAAPEGSVLLAQIQAGGTGLNIQAASVVVFCEPQIKPSLEHQAVSRAYRMGQVRDVLVHRLLCENSSDEKVLKMLEDKQLQFDSFADESVIDTEHQRRSEQVAIESIIDEEQKRIESEDAA
ncbi:MAG: DEAD/DEAH box helicase family protein [Clostridia bacterium]|nr:DEAD/DEAH box helicase family protein [Clostridia bacterium]